MKAIAKGLLDVFLDGILYFFFLGKNPIEKYHECHQKTDAENMAQDWRNVGDDIRAAMGKEGKCEKIKDRKKWGGSTLH